MTDNAWEAVRLTIAGDMPQCVAHVEMPAKVQRVVERKIVEQITEMQQHVMEYIQLSAGEVAHRRAVCEACEREEWENERENAIAEYSLVLQAEVDNMRNEHAENERARRRERVEAGMVAEAEEEDARMRKEHERWSRRQQEDERRAKRERERYARCEERRKKASKAAVEQEENMRGDARHAQVGMWHARGALHGNRRILAPASEPPHT